MAKNKAVVNQQKLMKRLGKIAKQIKKASIQLAQATNGFNQIHRKLEVPVVVPKIKAGKKTSKKAA